MWKQYSDKSKLPGEVIIEANKEEMSRSILIFYKKALYDKEKLLKDLTVSFSQSEIHFRLKWLPLLHR